MADANAYEFNTRAQAILNECYSLDDSIKSRIINLLEYGNPTPQQKATLMRYLRQMSQLQNKNLSQYANMFPAFWETLQQNVIRELLAYLHTEIK